MVCVVQVSVHRLLATALVEKPTVFCVTAAAQQMMMEDSSDSDSSEDEEDGPMNMASVGRTVPIDHLAAQSSRQWSGIAHCSKCASLRFCF
jgi:hypothetical protein